MVSDEASRQFLFATRCFLVCSLHVSTLGCTCITDSGTLITWALTYSQFFIIIIFVPAKNNVDIDFC